MNHTVAKYTLMKWNCARAERASEKKMGGAVEDIRNVFPQRPGEAKKVGFFGK